MADARPLMAIWCGPHVGALAQESCVTGLWTSIINTYFPLTAGPGGGVLGSKLLAAEVHSGNKDYRADLVLYEIVQRAAAQNLRVRIVFEAKSSVSKDTFDSTLNQCDNWTSKLTKASLGEGEVCFFIASKGPLVKMQVCKRQGSDFHTKSLSAEANPVMGINVVTLSNAAEDTLSNGTEIDMTQVAGRDIVHAAMQRIVASLAANNNGLYSWV